MQWNTICLELPHGSLKLVCSGLVMELKRQNRHIAALPIASAINERLNGLLPSLALEGGPTDRALMFSEAARRNTFPKWPHMNYKYVMCYAALDVSFCQIKCRSLHIARRVSFFLSQFFNTYVYNIYMI